MFHAVNHCVGRDVELGFGDVEGNVVIAFLDEFLRGVDADVVQTDEGLCLGIGELPFKPMALVNDGDVTMLVLATPAMMALMENAAMLAVADELPGMVGLSV